MFKKNNIDTLRGHGKLAGKGKVEVSGEDDKKTTYEAEHIILATGGRARALPNIPIDGEKVIGYRKAMVLEKQPKKMVVIGSGAIGVEFAYFYHTIGTEVTIVEYLPNIIPLEDEEVSKQLERIYKKAGVKIMTNSEVTKVDTKGKGCKVTVKGNKDGKETTIEHVVLSAVGVATNLENIGLEGAGVKLNERKDKVEVDDFYRTNVEEMYAIGDIVKGPALAHMASAEGITYMREAIAGMNPEPIDYHNIPGCTYCWPEVAWVGYTEKQAKEAGYDIRVGEAPFSASGKATAAGANEGFVKVIFDKKYGEWLGAHMIGANMTE